MTILTFVCGDAQLPTTQSELALYQVPTVPGKLELDAALSTLPARFEPDENSAARSRVLVVGSDAGLAAVLTRLMRTERLDVELGYVPQTRTAAARVYGLRTGARGLDRAIHGAATNFPLIRDDAGIALVGRAAVTGPGAGELEGEAYVDDTRLFSGTIKSMSIEPTTTMPGLRGRAQPGWGFVPPRWVRGRALQLGAESAQLTRDGVANSRLLKRSTFYRHTEDWLLAR